MTTEVQARDILAKAVDDAWKASQFSDVRLYSTSGPQPQVDVDTVFVQYEIVMNDANQSTLGETHWTRHRGDLVINFAAKNGGMTGERALLVMRQEMREAFDSEHFGSVKTTTPTPRRDPQLPGWNIKSLAVPFYFDELVT